MLKCMKRLEKKVNVTMKVLKSIANKMDTTNSGNNQTTTSATLPYNVDEDGKITLPNGDKLYRDMIHAALRSTKPSIRIKKIMCALWSNEELKRYIFKHRGKQTANKGLVIMSNEKVDKILEIYDYLEKMNPLNATQEVQSSHRTWISDKIRLIRQESDPKKKDNRKRQVAISVAKHRSKNKRTSSEAFSISSSDEHNDDNVENNNNNNAEDTENKIKKMIQTMEKTKYDEQKKETQPYGISMETVKSMFGVHEEKITTILNDCCMQTKDTKERIWYQLVDFGGEASTLMSLLCDIKRKKSTNSENPWSYSSIRNIITKNKKYDERLAEYVLNKYMDREDNGDYRLRTTLATTVCIFHFIYEEDTENTENEWTSTVQLMKMINKVSLNAEKEVTVDEILESVKEYCEMIPKDNDTLLKIKKNKRCEFDGEMLLKTKLKNFSQPN